MTFVIDMISQQVFHQVEIDWHVHIYPGYQFEDIFKRILEGLASSTDLAVLVLTERDDCSFYQKLFDGELRLSEKFKVSHLSSGILISYQQRSLLLVPGRQINTKEKIELLSLGSDQRISSGLETNQTIQQIQESGALPVINWAPGKWWFRRGQIVKDLMIKFRDQIYLCDTTLRPRLYPLPMLMRLGKRLNIPILIGSDPLPAIDEQGYIFSYRVRYACEFKLDDSLSALQKLTRSNSSTIVGQRSRCLELFRRLWRYYTHR
jgi:hypothetical protein